MENSDREKSGNNKFTESPTFPVPSFLRELNEQISITNDALSHSSNKQIINQAIEFHMQGKILEAEKYYQYCINQGLNDHIVFFNYAVILYGLGNLLEAEKSLIKAIKINPDSEEAYSNLGNIFKDQGKLKEAELCTRKAIELKPDFAIAHSNLGSILRNLGKLQEAELCTRKAIELKPSYASAYLNLGNILKDLGKLKEAESCTRKAIELKPDFAIAHSNLGSILRNLGKLQEAELSLLKAIEINPDFSIAYVSLSTLKHTNKQNKWKKQLFSKAILENKLKKNKVDIYFARSNILHKERNYQESAKYLQLANRLKLDYKPSNYSTLINKSKVLQIESDKEKTNYNKYPNCPESIFIVGMPRSGSTLVESILSMNSSVDDLGEINILEEVFLENRKVNQDSNLAQLYWKKVYKNNTKCKITTNKWLYNYQYVGFICKGIPNAKIIHCFRNPLDNILSIYRAHFAIGNDYSSSLSDCAKVYLNQEKIMNQYKNIFHSMIYDLNYESLVSNPNKEIKSLISWLGWEWNESYLMSHLNPRSVLTASSVEVRSPINSNSLGGWKYYRDMLQPAIDVLGKSEKYKDLTSN